MELSTCTSVNSLRLNGLLKEDSGVFSHGQFISVTLHSPSPAILQTLYTKVWNSLYLTCE
jgi:hypothetical protein